ncbi:MAG: SAM-dependent methyltransferase [Cellvibrionales bacterium]|nr:SAM-dependent methyltransferase [Cellvibrionales bacterium]
MFTEQSHSTYPTKSERTTAWEALAREISETNFHNQEGQQPTFSQTPGKLTIIGSGIEALSFSQQDRHQIQSADYVFYCVADPATVVWLKTERPDAHDLYVFYDDTKSRYTTYMQMTEAMLHYVRKGKHVVGIYYGHPGIFVLSTHRAIEIAKREGHEAIMRSGVSALDCLCADLGVDPSTPGLQTYEASDMMLRDKQPDTSAHVVLWQVGLIGELGYRRLGYLNNNFTLLIDYLKSFYSDTHEVVNYVASRYPGIPPTIERYTLNDLYHPEIQQKVTGISTFYLPPKEVRPINVERAIQLGVLKPGDTPKTPSSPLRQIANYSPKECLALDQLADFTVPKGYQWQEDTLGARFIIALLNDPKLLARYKQDPLSALNEAPYHKMQPRERQLLASKEAGLVQIAAKGLHQRVPGNTALLNAIIKQTSLARQVIKAQSLVDLKSLVASFNASIDSLSHDAARVGIRSAHIWSGVYYDASSNTLLCLLAPFEGHNKIALTLNGEIIHQARYHQGSLCWKAHHGNSTEGIFRFAKTSRNRCVAIGSISHNGHSGYESGRVEAMGVSPFTPSKSASIQREQLINALPFDVYQGEYFLRRSGNNKQGVDTLILDGDVVIINGTAMQDCHRVDNTIHWMTSRDDSQGGQLTFLYDPLSCTHHCYGHQGGRIYGMKQGSCSRADNLPTIDVGLPQQASKWLHEFACLGQDNGGILFWANWQKIAQAEHALTKLVRLIERA